MLCKWEGCAQDIPEDGILEHLSTVHVGYKRDKTFKNRCRWDTCNIYQYNRSKLVSHIMSHLDIRPYECKCLRKFKRKGDLVSHQRNCKIFFDSLVVSLFQ